MSNDSNNKKSGKRDMDFACISFSRNCIIGNMIMGKQVHKWGRMACFVSALCFESGKAGRDTIAC